MTENSEENNQFFNPPSTFGFTRKSTEDELGKYVETGRSKYLNDEFLRLLTENSSDGLAFFEYGKLIYASPAYNRMVDLEFPSTEITCLEDIFKRIHPDDMLRVVKEIEIAKKRKQKFQLYQLRFRKPNGEYCWLENSVTRQYNEKGENHRMFISTRDITEHKKTIHELLVIKEKLELALSSAKMGIWEWDIGTNTVAWYGETARLFGIMDKDFSGKIEDINKYIHPEDRYKGTKAFKNTVETGQEYINSYRVIWPDKSIHWLHAHGNLVNDENGIPIKIIGTTHEITNEKLNTEKIIAQNYKLTELNSTKDKLFSIVSHDLVNPLNSLMGYAQLLNLQHKTASRETIGQYQDMILKSAHAMADLLKSLSQWSRSQRKLLRLNQKAIVPKALLDYNTQLLFSSLRNKQIIVHNEISSHHVAYADEDMINTIIRNLLTNAIKFSNPHGTIVASSTVSENKCVYCISDNGIGMDSIKLKNIFSIAYSESEPGTAGEKGTGLGLLICKELIELNYGRIWAESEPGFGAAFYFEIPVYENTGS